LGWFKLRFGKHNFYNLYNSRAMAECHNAIEEDESKINFHLTFEGRTSNGIMIKTKTKQKILIKHKQNHKVQAK